MMALYASATFPPFFLATFWQKFPFKKMSVTLALSLFVTKASYLLYTSLLTTMHRRRWLSKLGRYKPNYVVSVILIPTRICHVIYCPCLVGIGLTASPLPPTDWS